jgi:hypothetical protein
MEGQDFLKIFFQHSTTSLNDVPSRKGGTFGTFCIIVTRNNNRQNNFRMSLKYLYKTMYVLCLQTCAVKYAVIEI